MTSNLEDFLLNPYEFLETASVKNLVEIAKQADIAYYNNDEPIMSDDEYELIKNRIQELDPNNPYLSKPAHQQTQLTQTITNKVKVMLPFTMGSMNKLKPTDADQIKQFSIEYPGPWIISDKLDGISALLVLNPDGKNALYTRGNGTIGTDITNLLSIINISTSKKINVKTQIVIRGELIMSKKNFKKYEDTMANARNMVAGIVNAKTIDIARAKDIDFIGYEMIQPWTPYKEQFEEISKLKIKVVSHSVINDLNIETLSNKLSKAKSESDYECDGIIITYNKPANRVASGNPPYAFAFKNLAELETAIVKVIKVEWNVSKDKYLKPRLLLTPTKLSGVTIRSVTANNAKYIVDNVIGPGAEIKLVRSGDVIPHILQVVKKATGSKPQLPEEGTYEWTDTNVDIIATSGSVQHKIKELSFFCSKLDIKNLSEGNIAKMIQAQIDSIPKILSVTKQDLLEVEGFKDKMVEKIFNGIHEKANQMTLVEFMSASNTFGHGMGERKIKKIMESIPDIIYQYIEKSDTDLINQIIELEGFDTITATQFINGLKPFLELMAKIPDHIQSRLLLDTSQVITNKSNKSSKLTGLKIVFSGFRNKEWEKYIESNQGQIATSVSKNTDILVTTQEDIDANTNSKLLKAKELGIKVLTKEQFEKAYIN